MAQTPQERRAAQRELARNLQRGETGISGYGRKANLVASIVQAKAEIYGDKPKFNAMRSAEVVIRNPETHKLRSIAELEKMKRAIEPLRHTFYPVDDEQYDEEEEFDRSWFFYQ